MELLEVHGLRNELSKNTKQFIVPWQGTILVWDNCTDIHNIITYMINYFFPLNSRVLVLIAFLCATIL